MSDRTFAKPDFRLLFEQSSGQFLVVDPGLRIVAASDAYLHAARVSREDIIGRHISGVIPGKPDDRPTNSAPRPSEASAANLKREQETVTRTAELSAANARLSAEIAERKRAQEALHESRAKLEAAIESMTDAVFISDAQGRFVDFNQAFVTFHRFETREECLKTLAEYPDILEVYAPDGVLAPLEGWVVSRALRGEVATDQEYTLRRKDTGETWVGSYSLAPIRNGNGDIVGSVVVGRDVTDQKRAQEALKESEERYRRVVQNTTAVILRIGTDGVIRFANDRALDIFGYSADELIGRHVVGAIVAEQESTGRDLTEMVRQVLDNPDGFHSNVNENMRKNGVRVWMEWTNSGIYDADGQLIEFLAVGIDVTALKEAERQIRAAEESRLEFYRRTIEVATGGKLVITAAAEIARMAGPAVASWELSSPGDLAQIRSAVEQRARAADMDCTKIGHFVISVGEAATNAIKHAGGGCVTMHRADASVIAVVSDRGPGIPALVLPDVALRPGYSTAGTLGMGYKMMIRFSDKVWLATGPGGTTVAVEVALQAAEAEPDVDALIMHAGGLL